jgi:hypothetical protein
VSEKSTVDRLVYMANQISDFFKSQGHGEESHPARVLGVADHIRAFWDPRMRRLIYEHLDQRDGEGLRPLAREAIESLMRRERSPQTVHAEAVAAGQPFRMGPGPGDDAG